MHLKQVHEHIDQCRKEDLDLLIQICKQPSVFVQNLGTREMQDICCDLLRMIQIEPHVYSQGGASYVFGEYQCPDPNARTVIIYGHSDVQQIGRAHV